MALTKEFRETVMARVKRDPEFRTELIIEATNCVLDGDIETGKRLLRDYLNATEMLPAIAEKTHLPEKSIRRMIGPSGNPTIKNFVNILQECCKAESIKLEICQH